ncbi:MAG TPA: hypothetical protein V6D05_17445 [Stenomitos sp.]
MQLETPCALLVWQTKDGKSLELLGEAKLQELVSQRPTMHLFALEVASGRTDLEPTAPERLIRHGHVTSDYLKRLQADRTPFIVTVDRHGLIHRLSYVDHWPLLSAVEARFGPVPAPRKTGWQRFLQLFKRD